VEKTCTALFIKKTNVVILQNMSNKQPYPINPGTWLFYIGFLHNSLVLVRANYRNAWLAMIKDGYFGSLQHNVHPEATAAFWYVMFGVAMSICGVVMQTFIHETGKPLHFRVGVALSIGSLLIILAAPLSGAWITLFLSIMIMVKSTK
jgi:hypothetical protein